MMIFLQVNLFLGLNIKKGNKIKEGLTVGKEYYVKFKLVPHEILGGWINVLHFTTGEDKHTPGSRIPALWFKDDTLLFHSDVNGDTLYGFTTSTKYVANETIDINIQQVLSDDKYFFEVIVNNESIHRRENTQPKMFKNVTLYVSDPWYTAQPGYIMDLQYSAG